MSFPWLADPDRYVHPRLSWLLACAFKVVLNRLFRIEHDLPPNYRSPSGCLLVSNHLRDSDGPIIGQLMFGRKGYRLRNPLPFFAMREDLYQREGLANLLFTCPWPFIRLLALIPIKWLFGNVRTYPLRRLREFTWHDTLRELVQAGLGGADPKEVFNARGRRELTQCLGTLPARVDAINPWRLGHMRVAHWGLRRLSLKALERLAPGFRETVVRQLRVFAEQLDAGQNVYFAPEGHVSMDGHFGRIRAGTWLLGQMTQNALPIQPFSLSYDPLGPGRTRIVVRHGELLEDLDYRDSRHLAERLRDELMARRVVTPSHLLAHFLCVRSTPFGVHELAAWLDEAAAAAQDANVMVDPLFGRVSSEVMADERLRWLARKRLVWPVHGMWHRRFSPDTPPTWRNTPGIVRYLANALADFAPELAKALPQ
ncbi:MAG TPA: hypothetical protein VFG67_05180 [Oleiagrimonas sp.]|nr:hypothetical protein [Oleiagrimonas sp.]